MVSSDKVGTCERDGACQWNKGMVDENGMANRARRGRDGEGKMKDDKTHLFHLLMIRGACAPLLPRKCRVCPSR